MQGHRQSRIDSLIRQVLDDVEIELHSAMQKFPPFNSDHEAYAVLLEEVDEYKAHVYTRKGSRDREAMAGELYQVAAMAVRNIVELHLMPDAKNDSE